MATAQGYGVVLKDRRALSDLDFHSGVGGMGSVGGCQGHLNRALLVLRNVKESDCVQNRAGGVGKAQEVLPRPLLILNFRSSHYSNLKKLVATPTCHMSGTSS